MRTKAWMAKHTRSLKGKTVAISGSTGGLGRALCEHLAALGADLIFLNRSPERSSSLARELTSRHPGLSVTHIGVDMEDMASVKRATEELSALPVDYLILNAGAYDIPRHTCSTGFDNVYQINCMSPYYMARTLLSLIRSRGGRIVAVGSIAHRYSATDPADVDFSGRTKASLVYGNAKRRLTASLWGLGEGVAVAHPGITFTGITDHYPPLIFALIKHPMKVIFPRPGRACLSVLWGLFTPARPGQWLGPRFFDIWGTPAKKPLRSIPEDEQTAICTRTESDFLML